MIIKVLYNYYIQDNEPVKIEHSEFWSQEGEVYEVVRIMDGVPLFIEDHIKRFFNSACLAGATIEFNATEIRKRVESLICINKIGYGNIRFSYYSGFRAFFIPHKYPCESDYRNGIQCGFLYRERSNPQAKTVQENVRVIADQLLGETDFHEVLLVDHDDHITEGSRSNFFLVKNDVFYTPPLRNILPGTTRKRVIALITTLGWRLVEDTISVSDLPSFEAAFITGTSPKILPVRQIENYSFRSKNGVLQRLMKEYDSMIAEYLEKMKR